MKDAAKVQQEWAANGFPQARDNFQRPDMSENEIKPVAWRFKDFHPLLNGGFAYGYTHDPESHVRDEPLYDQSAINRLTAERNAAVADAERYRWLKRASKAEYLIARGVFGLDDGAIDAARAEVK